MRLARKITLAMVLGMCLVLAINSYLGVRASIGLFEADMHRDHLLVGETLAAAMVDAWHAAGRERALRLAAEADRRSRRVRIRWSDAAPAALGVTASSSGDFVTTMPVVSDGATLGWLLISESRDDERAFIHLSVTRTLGNTVGLAFVGAVVAAALGLMFVGRPMAKLADKARRVGTGDLGGPLVLGQRDEIGELARDMNVMCDRLREARETVAAETEARLSALEQLRHADRLATIGKLASGIAHELGTPLNVVVVRAKMIASGEIEGVAAGASARIIGEQTERIIRIIRQLLDFARTGQGTRTPAAERESVDLRLMARHTSTLIQPLAAKKQIVVDLVEEGASVTARVDRGLLQQALMNLLVNALSAMKRPGRISIEVGHHHVQPPADHSGAPGDYVRLAVRDQGEGILPSVLPHIFEPFFTTKEVGEGTGLGLSVTYGIVHDHGGWITTDTQVGAGSCFALWLPPG